MIFRSVNRKTLVSLAAVLTCTIAVPAAAQPSAPAAGPKTGLKKPQSKRVHSPAAAARAASQGMPSMPDAVPPASAYPPAVPVTPSASSVDSSPPITDLLPSPELLVSPNPVNPNANVPPRTLSLDQVVAAAVNSNSTVTIARQRLQKAQELITQANAEALPQISATLADTYSSNPSFATSSANVANPTLPGGGQIPVITDQGGGTSGTFIGGGGGGTTSSNGQSSTTAGGSTLAPSSTGTTTAAPSSGSSGASGTGTGTSGTGTGTSGTGTGTSGTGSGSGSGATGGGTGSTGSSAGGAALAALPPMLQEYADTSGANRSAAAVQTASASRVAHPSDASTGTTDTTGTGTGTGGTGQNSSGGKRNNYSGRLNVTQYIDIFGYATTARDVEKFTRDFYQTDLDRVQNETALSAKTAYYTVLRDQAQVAVQQDQVAAARESLRITQAKYAAGTSPAFDVLTAEATLSNDLQTLSADQSTLNQAEANLDNLLGIDPNTPLTLQEPPIPPLDQRIDLNQSTQTAFAGRPELRQAENNIVIAKKLVKLAGSTLAPTFGLVGSANYNGNVSAGTPHDVYTITAQIGIPLYDGGATQSRVRSAQVDLQTQYTTRDQLRQNVSLEVRQAYLNVVDAQTRAASATLGAQQAAEALRIANVRYQNGLSTLLDVQNAEAQAATTRTNLSNAQYDYQTALAQLTRAEGGR